MNALVAAEIHDLKNLLFALASEAAAHETHPICQRHAALLTQAAERLTYLLTLYKAHSGLLVAQVQDVVLHDFLAPILDECRQMVGQDRQFIHECAHDLPQVWSLDARLAELALREAVRNALRYARRTITLRIFRNREERLLCFEVADDGPGYPELLLKEGPMAVATSLKEQTHLGLALIETVMRAHTSPRGHGRIQLQNRQGAVLTLMFP